MMRHLPFAACVVFLLPAFARAQDLAEADRLCAEGASLNEASQFSAAAGKYEEAVRAYESALGKDTPECAKRTLLPRRTIAWCRAQAGEFEALPAAFEGFFGTALRSGGNDKEEDAVLDCLKWSLLALGQRKDDAGMEAAHAGYEGALRKTLEAARSEKGRERELQFFVDRLEIQVGRALQELGEAFFTAEFREKGQKAFERAAARWRERKQLARVCWCLARMGDAGALKESFQPFFDAALSAGGDEEQETVARDALSRALEDQALKPDEAEILAVFAAYADAVKKTQQAAGKDGRRAKELAPFLARLDRSAGLAQEALSIALLGAGNREKGTQEYRKAVKYWEERKDLLQASRVPENAFFETTLYRRTAFADYFLLETLQAVRKHRFAAVEQSLSVHLRDFLNRLLEENKIDEAILFLESTIVLGKTSGAFSGGIDEGYLRVCLEEYLWTKQAWDKVIANGDTLVRLGREVKYPFWEGLGSTFSGYACLRKGANEDALARFEVSVPAASLAGDTARLGYGWMGRCRALSALKKYKEADEAVWKAMEAYEAAKMGTNLTQARQEALANAKAWGNEDKIRGYNRLLRMLTPAGGIAGRRIGAMAPADLFQRVQKQEKSADVLEISREGDRLVFKNLLDGSTAEDAVESGFHYVNVSGVLFQVKGRELLLWGIYGDSTSPDGPGETVEGEGEDVKHEGADFSLFGQRHLVDPGSVLRVTSAAQLVRVKKP